MLNSRVLFAVTLMAVLWFDASATIGTQHKTKPSVSSDAVAPQISSISRRAEQGDRGGREAAALAAIDRMIEN